MTRNILNLVMTFGVVAVMDYRFTGNGVHEILGVFLAGLFLAHNILNRYWYRSFSKGGQNLLRVIITITNLLLLVMMLGVMVTGVLISQTLFAAFSLSGYLWVHQLHTFSAYSSFILCGIHVGLHWGTLWRKLCQGIGLDASRERVILLGQAISLFIVVYGINASFSHQIGAKLMFEHVFGGWGSTPSLLDFLIDYPAIFGCYTIVTHYLVQWLQKPKQLRV